MSSTSPNDARAVLPFDPGNALDRVFHPDVFRDARLHDRAQTLWRASAQQFESCGAGDVAKSSRAERKAAGRMFRNSRIETKALMGYGTKFTLNLVADSPSVIAMHDSSEIDLTGRFAPRDAGPLRSSNARGYMLHAVALIDGAEHVSRGFLAAHAWTRDWDLINRSRDRPAHLKESYKWKRGLRVALAVAPKEARRWIHVMDREGDVHENFEFATKEKLRVVVGAQSDHSIVEGSGKLWNHLRDQPIRDDGDFEMIGNESGRREHRRLSLRSATVTLLPRKKHASHRHRKPVALNVVYVRGEGANQEWMLFTTCPVETIKQAWAVFSAYRVRTVGEEMFKMLKTGLGFEDHSIDSITMFRRKIALLLPLATLMFEWRYRARATPTAPANEVVDNEMLAEMKSCARRHRIKLPKGRWSIRHVISCLAQLGGYEPRRDQPPGWLTLWRGWHVFDVFRSTRKFILSDAALRRK